MSCTLFPNSAQLRRSVHFMNVRYMPWAPSLSCTRLVLTTCVCEPFYVILHFFVVFLLHGVAVVLEDILSFVSVGHVVENARLVDVDGGATAVMYADTPQSMSIIISCPSLSCTDVPSPIRSTTAPSHVFTPSSLLW